MARQGRRIVATEIEAGLGNRMFQYAIARRLAHVNDAELRLLLSDSFNESSSRVYGLGNFSIAGREQRIYRGFGRLSRARRRLGRALPWLATATDRLPLMRDESLYEMGHRAVVNLAGPRTKNLVFLPEVLALRGSYRLAGFWQDERYFSDIAEMIRSDFTLKEPLDARSTAVLGRIMRGPSAFMHVRRGDYLARDSIDFFGTRSPQYYHRALQTLRARVGEDVGIYVFSDDAAWVREHQIGGPDAEIIDWNGSAPQRDLTLMRHCRHAVIANSSFSWWGAWLGDGPQRVVIAPQIWLVGLPLYDDIVPERWLREE